MARTVGGAKARTILSSGGGLDSFAMLLDAIDRAEKPDMVIFADVGSREGEGRDGEWPSTYRHLREVVMPLCEREGVEFVWLNTGDYPIRGHESLLAYFEATRTMPTRMSRMCSSAAKIERVEAYLDARFPGERVEVWIGYEAGEEGRAANDPHGKATEGLRTNRFPLMERGLCRCRCETLVRSHGHPVPRKSACVFCPFSSRGDFQTLAREMPLVFTRVARMEENCRTTASGKVIRYGYEKGDGSDPALPEWAAKPYKPRAMGCGVCGAERRASKATGCGYLEH